MHWWLFEFEKYKVDIIASFILIFPFMEASRISGGKMLTCEFITYGRQMEKVLSIFSVEASSGVCLNRTRFNKRWAYITHKHTHHILPYNFHLFNFFFPFPFFLCASQPPTGIFPFHSILIKALSRPSLNVFLFYIVHNLRSLHDIDKHCQSYKWLSYVAAALCCHSSDIMEGSSNLTDRPTTKNFCCVFYMRLQKVFGVWLTCRWLINWN